MIGFRLACGLLPAALAVLAFGVVLPAAPQTEAAGGAGLEVPRDAVTTIVGPSFAGGFPRDTRVADAGDVNGDGRPDLLFRNVQGHGGDEARNYLLYGGRWPSLIRPPIGGSRGFGIRGEWVAAVGDVNGDGHADLVRCDRIAVGPAVVLFGRTGRRSAVDRGFRVVGGCPERAGDVDGDGRVDLLVATYSRQELAATVLFGRRPPKSFDAARPGRDGFRIAAARFAGVTAVGDANGDRRDDLVVDLAGRSTRLLVVFGRRRSGIVDTRRPGRPTIVDAGFHREIASAGDVNADGIGDFAFGIVHHRACLLLGRRGAWPDMTRCGGPGSIVVDRPVGDAAFGSAVGTAGDLDRDGYSDILVSAPGEPLPGAGFSDSQGGAVYVVYGREGERRINVATDPRVVRVAAARDLRQKIGSSLAGPGDLTGDGVDDVVVGGYAGDGWIVSPRAP